MREFGAAKFEIVYPWSSILAEPPVALVDNVVDKHGTRKVAQAYLEFLYSPAGQEIVARNFYRPIDPRVAAQHAAQFPKLALFTIDEVFGAGRRRRRPTSPTAGCSIRSTASSDDRRACAAPTL